jgi:RNA-directed DNA polymerase
MSTIKRKLKTASEKEKPPLLKELKERRSLLLKTPAKSQTDEKLKYIRYAVNYQIILGINFTLNNMQMTTLLLE